MWLLGSPAPVVMDEGLSSSARSVQSPGTVSTVHSIEAILGFREDALFHKSTSYNMTDRDLSSDAERTGSVTLTLTKKSRYSDGFDGEFTKFYFINVINNLNELIIAVLHC